jgi:hypothetical protein
MFSATKASSVLRSTVNGNIYCIYHGNEFICCLATNVALSTFLLILFIYSIVARRTYSNQGGYESTYKNLMINKNTKVICQGFTGKQVK